MKKLILVFSLLFFISNLWGQNTFRLKKDFLITCGDDRVIVVNPHTSTTEKPDIVWQWSVGEAKDAPEEYQKLLIPLDDCKPVNNNTQILLTASGGATALLDVASRKLVFYAKTPNAHSAEMLPGNFIAVANSTHAEGNSLELYHTNKPEQVLYKDSLYSGHGVVYNSNQKRLYVLGFQLLKAYNYNLKKNGEVALTHHKSWVIPDRSGHDLFLVNGKNMLITTHHNVFNFNIDTEKFTVFDMLRDRHNVKSVYFDGKKKIVYTIAEQNWWTFNIYGTAPDIKINIPTTKLYKVRVVR